MHLTINTFIPNYGLVLIYRHCKKVFLEKKETIEDNAFCTYWVVHNIERYVTFLFPLQVSFYSVVLRRDFRLTIAFCIEEEVLFCFCCIITSPVRAHCVEI